MKSQQRFKSPAILFLSEISLTINFNDKFEI
jgi:hypothetical protein